VKSFQPFLSHTPPPLVQSIHNVPSLLIIGNHSGFFLTGIALLLLPAICPHFDCMHACSYPTFKKVHVHALLVAGFEKVEGKEHAHALSLVREYRRLLPLYLSTRGTNQTYCRKQNRHQQRQTSRFLSKLQSINQRLRILGFDVYISDWSIVKHINNVCDVRILRGLVLKQGDTKQSVAEQCPLIIIEHFEDGGGIMRLGADFQNADVGD